MNSVHAGGWQTLLEDDHPALRYNALKKLQRRVTTTHSNRLPVSCRMARGSGYGGTDEAASGEAVLRGMRWNAGVNLSFAILT